MMLTSSEQPEDIARCRELGVAAYLIKPVRRKELFSSLMAALGEASHKDTHETGWLHADAPPAEGLHVLIVEDNPVNRKVVCSMLERCGHPTTAVQDGLEAVAAAEDGAYDLILMDVQMPVMNGFEATERIRDRERRRGVPRVPIVAMTAHAMKGDREKCLGAGMDDYLAKPIKKADLLGVIRRIRAGSVHLPEAGAGAFDPVVAMEQAEGDRSLFSEIVQLFIADCPALLGRAEEALRLNDAKSLAEAVHTLKGSVANFGASGAMKLAGQIESLLRNGEMEGVDGLWTSLRLELETLQASLQAFLREDPIHPPQ
jgi:CheY-like chemotaxis protein